MSKGQKQPQGSAAQSAGVQGLMSQSAAANAQAQQGMQSAAAKEKETERPTRTVDGRMELRRPLIELKAHMFPGGPFGQQQVNKLNPDRAYIAHGVIVIEEFNLWLPLSEVKVGRWT